MQSSIESSQPPAIVVTVAQPTPPTHAPPLVVDSARGMPALAAISLPNRNLRETLTSSVKLVDEASELVESGLALCTKYSSHMEWAGVAKVAINVKRHFQSETNARISRLRCDLITLAKEALPEITANLYSESLVLRTLKDQLLSSTNVSAPLRQMIETKVEDFRHLRELGSGKMKFNDMLNLSEKEIIGYLIKANRLAPKATPKIAAALATFAADLKGVSGEKRTELFQQLINKVREASPELAQNMRPLLEKQ